jgi:aminopeptidase N
LKPVLKKNRFFILITFATMKSNVLSFLILMFACWSFAQDDIDKRASIDVFSYDISISLNDSTDQIEVVEKVSLRFLKPSPVFYLDLQEVANNSQGMKVLSVKEEGKELSYVHQNSLLSISVEITQIDDLRTFELHYKGVPKDGLVIAKNKFGHRTFFGDNWPNRAHQWFACVDHPSDKATVIFRVEVPDHYEVVANGEMVQAFSLPKGRKQVVYDCTVPLPTKVMVIGVADFEVQELGMHEEVPISSWVYPENKKEGFYDFAQASTLLKFFTSHFGNYPFSKLANVQSTTRFGGMENAGCIFYDENSITGKRNNETLMVHEIAHQWFGNSASESDWSDLWLSEGFATYCTNLYLEEVHGTSVFVDQLKKDRNRVIQFYRRNKTPVIDTLSSDLMYLLNANAYQKGSWFLHMLRRKIGEENFWKGMADYYDRFATRNASTRDFREIMENSAGMDLKSFFDQWLRKEGHPVLAVKYRSTRHQFTFSVAQRQSSGVFFEFPLEIELQFSDQSTEVKTFLINTAFQEFSFPVSAKVVHINVDPNTSLLFEKSSR